MLAFDVQQNSKQDTVGMMADLQPLPRYESICFAIFLNCNLMRQKYWRASTLFTTITMQIWIVVKQIFSGKSTDRVCTYHSISDSSWI